MLGIIYAKRLLVAIVSQNWIEVTDFEFLLLLCF